MYHEKQVYGGVFGCVVFGLMVADVHAFCIYNKTDVDIFVEQVSGGSFFKGMSVKIPVNEYKCCNWQNHDCNTSGKRDGIVAFDVFYMKFSLYSDFKAICKNFHIQAGGWITVEGSNEHHRFVRHDYNQ